MNTYNGQFHNGTWVWEVNPDSALIKFDGNGGYTTAEDVIVKSDDEAVTMPDMINTTLVRHMLIGWNTEPDGSGENYLPGETYSGVAKLGQIVTLYAQWEETDLRRYTVNHYQENPWSGFDLFETSVHYAEKETSVTPEVKEYEGFVSPEPITEKVLDDDSLVIDYYYNRYHYYIVYDGNGATSGTMPTIRYAYNMPDWLAANNYQKTASVFTGWNTEPDGSGRSFTNGQNFINLVSENE